MAFDNLDKAFEQSGAFTWKDEDGDQIVGEILAMREQANKFNPQKVDPVLTLRVLPEHQSTERDGEPIPAGETRTVYCSRGGLRSSVEREAPRVGDAIAIRQNGTYEAKMGTGINYDVAVERAAQGEAYSPFE